MRRSGRAGVGGPVGWIRAAALATIAAAPAAAAGAERAGGHGEAPVAVVEAVASWVAGELALPAAASPPTIRFAPPERLAALRYGDAAGHGALEVVALYHDAERTIYLPEGWTGATLEEQSVLVHEMVHHLQNLADLRFACPAEREQAAYAAQAAWLERAGGSLQRSFGIDAMTLLLRTRCFY
jgi:hypothetical protein